MRSVVQGHIMASRSYARETCGVPYRPHHEKHDLDLHIVHIIYIYIYLVYMNQEHICPEGSTSGCWDLILRCVLSFVCAARASPTLRLLVGPLGRIAHSGRKRKYRFVLGAKYEVETVLLHFDPRTVGCEELHITTERAVKN